MSRSAVLWLTVTAGVVVVAAVLLSGLWLDRPVGPDAEGTIEVVVDRYRFEPDVIAVPTGEQVTLRFVNRNNYIYHLNFGRELLEDDGRTIGFADDLFAGVAVAADPAAAWSRPAEGGDAGTLNIYEGATSELVVTLPADRTGTWDAGCFVGRGCDAELRDAFRIVVE